MMTADFQEETGLRASGITRDRAVFNLADVYILRSENLQHFEQRAYSIPRMHHEHGVVMTTRDSAAMAQDDEPGA